MDYASGTDAEERRDHPVCEALRARNRDVIRDFCREMFDFELTDYEVDVLCHLWAGRKTDWRLSSGPAIWIKNRLYNLGTFRTPGIQPSDEDERVAPVVLHVFFTCLEETQGMLQLLRNELFRGDNDRDGTARSRLFKSAQYVRPIDKTAYKVSDFQKLMESLGETP